jgi:hypothetical protein
VAGPFELSIRQFAARAGENADKVVRDVVLEIWSRVIIRSPVDTGRFRANWQYSLGQMRPGSLTVTGSSAAPASAPGAPLVGLAGAAKAVHVIHNNLPYARSLEYGHSQKQAPNGMVRLTIREFANIVDGAAKGAKK